MTTLRQKRCWLSGLQMAIGLAALGLAIGAVEAKPPANQSDSRDDRLNNRPQVNHNAAASQVRQAAPPREIAVPSRATRRDEFRSFTTDRPVETRRQSLPPTRERMPAVDMRRSLAASGNDAGGSDKQGQQGGRGDRGVNQPSRPLRDNPPQPRGESGARSIERQAPPRPVDSARPVERQTPPPRADVENRTRASDVRARLERNNDGSGSPQTVGDRQDNAVRRADRNTRSEVKSSAPPAPQEGRTKAADVRGRLEKRDQGKQAQSVEPRSEKASTATLGSLKAKEAKSAANDTPQSRPAGDRSKPPHEVAGGVKTVRFADQVKSGKLEHLTKSETATKIKLAEQYRMYGQGDVARRLQLDSHVHDAAKFKAENLHRFTPAGIEHNYVHHPSFYHGVVSPGYHHSCLQLNYWGPSFFVGLCWYPHWSPWVDWSWHHHHHVYWDPRPIWCRPVIYEPCPVWVYWDVPVWTPLPEVACGTWVDLKPVAVAALPDLQLAAIRFVDPGHPEEKLGPRYRVWFRNNGAEPITHPFNVVLFAANGDQLAANVPQAGVRVRSIEANDTQSVDIRLPIEAMTASRDAQGNPAPFSMLHVLVDAQQEIHEPLETNNGTRLVPMEVLPVDPAAFEVDPASAKPGAEVILAGEGLGPEPGQLLVHVNGQELQAEIQGWYDLGIRWTLPKAAIAAPTEAEVIVVRGDGAATNPLKLTINP